MSRSLAAIGSISGLIKQLGDNAEYLETLFEQREMYLEAGDNDMRRRVERLRRELIVRVEPDNQGGGLVRLSSHVRQLFIQSTRRDRVQGLDINVKDTFDRVDLRLEAWRRAQSVADHDEAELAEDRIRDDVELIEQRYTERLEHIQDRISFSYGFDIQDEGRSREFRYYLASIEEMRIAGREFCRILHDDAYDGVPFISALAARMDMRFRRHGETIVDIRRSLDQYLARVRDRQRVTRRNMRFLHWMRSHSGRIEFEAAAAHADRLSLLHRPAGLALSAAADIYSPICRPAFEELAAQILRRHRSRIRASNSTSVESAPERADSDERTQRAKQAHERETQRQWDPSLWLDDYLVQSIKARLGQPAPGGLVTLDKIGVSALAYWRYRSGISPAGSPCPSPRAWLSELLQMALTNRPIGHETFFARFQIHLVPAAPVKRTGAQHIITDLTVQPRDDAIAATRAAQ